MEPYLPPMLGLITFALLFCNQASATPLPLNLLSEGSGGAEQNSHTLTPYVTQGSSHVPTTLRISLSGRLERSFLSQVSVFMHDHMLVVVIVASLLSAVLLLAFCASTLSSRRKTSSYYPSSYPSGKYVDQTDKCGGSRAFSEVPARPPDSPVPEHLNSAQQLQEDIQKAVRNLRTPNKTPKGEVERKDDTHTHAHVNGSVEDQPEPEVMDEAQTEPSTTCDHEGDLVSNQPSPEQEAEPHKPAAACEEEEGVQQEVYSDGRETTLPAVTIMAETSAL